MSFDSHRVWDGDCKLENVENVVMLAPCWMWYKRLCVVCRCHKEDERGGKGTDWGWFSVKIWEISFNHTHFYSVLTFLLTSNLSRRQQHRNYWRMRSLSNRTLIIINILKILTLHSDRFSFLFEDGEWFRDWGVRRDKETTEQQRRQKIKFKLGQRKSVYTAAEKKEWEGKSCKRNENIESSLLLPPHDDDDDVKQFRILFLFSLTIFTAHVAFNIARARVEMTTSDAHESGFNDDVEWRLGGMA